MEALAERVKQGLGIGDFKPTSLEAHHLMIVDLQEYQKHMLRFKKAAQAFEAHTGAFLGACGAFLEHAPFPRAWRQPDLTKSAVPLHTSVPEEAAPMFTGDLHRQLATGMPQLMKNALHNELLGPVDQWLAAYDGVKDVLVPLEGLRLRYDAARRRLQAKQEEATAFADVPGEEAEQQPAAEQQAEEHEPSIIREFETREAAVMEDLTVLAISAIRLKAYIAHLLHYMEACLVKHVVPLGLLRPFPAHLLAVSKDAPNKDAGKAQVEGAQPAGVVEPPENIEDRTPEPYESTQVPAGEARLFSPVVGAEALEHGLGMRARKMSEELGGAVTRERCTPTDAEVEEAHGKAIIGISPVRGVPGEGVPSTGTKVPGGATEEPTLTGPGPAQVLPAAEGVQPAS